MGNETSKTLGLFDDRCFTDIQFTSSAYRARSSGRGGDETEKDRDSPDDSVDPWPTVAIAGVRIDFGQPSAPRIAAATIFELGPDARPAALDLVPSNFRGFVSDLIERAIYNEKNKKWLK